MSSVLTDLRVGLSAVLAGQAVLLDSLTGLGVPAKLVTSALGLVGAALTVFQLVSESKSPVTAVEAVVPVVAKGVEAVAPPVVAPVVNDVLKAVEDVKLP